MILPGPDSKSVRAILDGARRHYDFDLSYADYETIAERLADPGHNHFSVRHIAAFGPDLNLFAVRHVTEDDRDVWLAILRSSTNRIPVDILSPDALEAQVNELRYFTRLALAQFGIVRERMIEHFGFSFFTHGDYVGLTEAIRAGQAKLVGENSFELGYQHPSERSALRIVAAFDPDREYITDVLQLRPITRAQNRFERPSALESLSA